MLRSVCVVVVLPSLIMAQTPTDSMNAGSRSPGGQTAVEPATYQQYTYYRQIRRGTTEKVAIKLMLENGFVTSPRAPIAGISPLKLELEAKDGITVREIKYPEAIRHSVQFQTQPIMASWDPTIKFKVRADSKTTLGEHVLNGKLTFQVLTSTGISATQQLSIAIPLNVVERHAKVQKTWPYHEMPQWEIAILIVLAPVALVLVIPMSLACNVGVKSGCF